MPIPLFFFMLTGGVFGNLFINPFTVTSKKTKHRLLSSFHHSIARTYNYLQFNLNRTLHIVRDVFFRFFFEMVNCVLFFKKAQLLPTFLLQFVVALNNHEYNHKYVVGAQWQSFSDKLLKWGVSSCQRTLMLF